MESLISEIVKYLLCNYPNKDDLSASRLTKIVYLADWKSALEYARPLTGSTWHFNHYGPYVDDFISVAKKDEDVEVLDTRNVFGARKLLLKIKDSFEGEVDLDEEQIKILDFVISATKDKSYQEFINLVYSTYPVVSSDRYSDLDLVSMAREYRKISGREKAKIPH